MTQAIITAIGSAGDVHPLLGIGDALAARGHEIVFCTHHPFADAVRRHGFRFEPIGSAEDYAAAMANPALWHPRTSFRTLLSVIAPTVRPHFARLAALAGADTVLVGSLWAFSARLMQELHGTPFVSVQVSPSTLLSAHAPPTHKRLTIPTWLPLPMRRAGLSLVERCVLDRACAPALNAVRRELGLAPARRILGDWLHSREGVLCLFPAWFAPPQPDWPRRAFLAGFPLHNETDKAGEGSVDAEFDAFLAGGTAPVVFTAGSTLVDPAKYLCALAQVLRATGLRAVLLGPHAPEGRSPSGNLFVRRYVPMTRLLPRCRALVHHGGIGTASLAFAAGIAQVVTPFAHDQFDNAQRVADLRCGVRLDAPVRGGGLARALERVLASQEIAHGCALARERLRADGDGCKAAADFIESFMPRSRRSAARAAGKEVTGS